MGKTIISLSKKELPKKAIFNNRFVVEVAESFHIHYRNLRIILSELDWREFGKGMHDSWKRWVERGEPLCGNKHIELCRKEVAKNELESGLCKINLNKNLYALNEGRIFSDGADLIDEMYIHLKIRDLRIEMTKAEFKEFAEAVKEASDAL